MTQSTYIGEARISGRKALVTPRELHSSVKVIRIKSEGIASRLLAPGNRADVARQSPTIFLTTLLQRNACP